MYTSHADKQRERERGKERARLSAVQCFGCVRRTGFAWVAASFFDQFRLWNGTARSAPSSAHSVAALRSAFQTNSQSACAFRAFFDRLVGGYTIIGTRSHVHKYIQTSGHWRLSRWRLTYPPTSPKRALVCVCICVWAIIVIIVLCDAYNGKSGACFLPLLEKLPISWVKKRQSDRCRLAESSSCRCPFVVNKSEIRAPC